MDAAQAKRNRLPFKPPRRQSEGTNSSATNKTTSKTTSRKPSSTSATSASRPSSKTTTAASRVSSSKSKTTSSKTASTSNSRKRKAQSITISSDSEDSNPSNPSENNSDNEDSRSKSRSASPEPDYILAEIVTDTSKPRNIESDEPGIPPKLLTTILHHQFQNKKTKITKDANEVVAKYMDIFVREALARAAFERADAATKDGGGQYVGDGFLEVEDLEKLAPQMLLDF